MITEPHQINAWRLLALYHMLKLELKGMHHSSGLRASVAIRQFLQQAQLPHPQSRTALLKEYQKCLIGKGILQPIDVEVDANE